MVAEWKKLVKHHRSRVINWIKTKLILFLIALENANGKLLSYALINRGFLGFAECC